MVMVATGVIFELPIFILALARIGIVEVDQLKGLRRYIYFALAALACAITPGDPHHCFTRSG